MAMRDRPHGVVRPECPICILRRDTHVRCCLPSTQTDAPAFWTFTFRISSIVSQPRSVPIENDAVNVRQPQVLVASSPSVELQSSTLQSIFPSHLSWFMSIYPYVCPAFFLRTYSSITSAAFCIIHIVLSLSLIYHWQFSTLYPYPYLYVTPVALQPLFTISHLDCVSDAPYIRTYMQIL